VAVIDLKERDVNELTPRQIIDQVRSRSNAGI
jgi:hypothetical protein